MPEKESSWLKGWWLIPLIIFLGFIAWKAYPYLKASETVKKLIGRTG